MKNEPQPETPTEMQQNEGCAVVVCVVCVVVFFKSTLLSAPSTLLLEPKFVNKLKSIKTHMNKYMYSLYFMYVYHVCIAWL